MSIGPNRSVLLLEVGDCEILLRFFHQKRIFGPDNSTLARQARALGGSNWCSSFQRRLSNLFKQFLTRGNVHKRKQEAPAKKELDCRARLAPQSHGLAGGSSVLCVRL